MLDQYRETFQFIHYLSTEEQCLMKSIVCFFLSNKEKWKELPGFFFSLIDGGRPIWNELIIHYINVMALD